MYTGTSISLPTDQETSSLYVNTQGHQITPFNEDKFSVRVSQGRSIPLNLAIPFIQQPGQKPLHPFISVPGSQDQSTQSLQCQFQGLS